MDTSILRTMNLDQLRDQYMEDFIALDDFRSSEGVPANHPSRGQVPLEKFDGGREIMHRILFGVHRELWTLSKRIDVVPAGYERYAKDVSVYKLVCKVFDGLRSEEQLHALSWAVTALMQSTGLAITAVAHTSNWYVHEFNLNPEDVINSNRMTRVARARVDSFNRAQGKIGVTRPRVKTSEPVDDELRERVERLERENAEFARRESLRRELSTINRRIDLDGDRRLEILRDLGE